MKIKQIIIMLVIACTSLLKAEEPKNGFPKAGVIQNLLNQDVSGTITFTDGATKNFSLKAKEFFSISDKFDKIQSIKVNDTTLNSCYSGIVMSKDLSANKTYPVIEISKSWFRKNLYCAFAKQAKEQKKDQSTEQVKETKETKTVSK